MEISYQQGIVPSHIYHIAWYIAYYHPCCNPRFFAMYRDAFIGNDFFPSAPCVVYSDRVFLIMFTVALIKMEVFTCCTTRCLFSPCFFKNVRHCFYTAHVHNLAGKSTSDQEIEFFHFLSFWKCI